MDSSIRPIVDAVLPNERGNVLLTAEAALIEINSNDYALEIESIVSISGSIDTAELIDRMTNCIASAIVKAIKEYSVEIVEYDLTVLPKILLGLLYIPDYDDKESLLAICENNDSPDDALIEMLVLVQGGESIDYQRCISHVNPKIIERTVHLLSNNIVVQEDEEGVVVEQKKDYTHASKFIKKYQPEKFMSLLSDGWKLGYKTELYLKETIPSNTVIDVDTTAIEYVTASLASGENITDGITKVGDRLDDYIHDIYILQRILQKVRFLLTEVIA